MLGKLKHALLRFHNDDRGAMSAEYMLLLALVGIPVAILLYIFGKKVVTWFKSQDAALDAEHSGS